MLNVILLNYPVLSISCYIFKGQTKFCLSFPPTGAEQPRWGDSLLTPLGGQMEHHGDDVCGGSCVDSQRISGTIPTVGNLRGGSFLFPSKPLQGLSWVQHDSRSMILSLVAF